MTFCPNGVLYWLSSSLMHDKLLFFYKELASPTNMLQVPAPAKTADIYWRTETSCFAFSED